MMSICTSCTHDKLDETKVLQIFNNTIHADTSWKTFQLTLTSYYINGNYLNGLLRNNFIVKRESVNTGGGLGTFYVDNGEVYTLTDKAMQYVVQMIGERNAVIREQAFVKVTNPVSIYYPVEGGNEADIEMTAVFKVTPFYNSNLNSNSNVEKRIKCKMKKFEDGWRIDNPDEIRRQLAKCN